MMLLTLFNATIKVCVKQDWELGCTKNMFCCRYE